MEFILHSKYLRSSTKPKVENKIVKYDQQTLQGF